MIRLTRRYRFSASHRLHSVALPEAENRALYGKCNNPYGHGHDYLLEVRVAGAIDQSSGRVIHAPALDELVSEQVLKDFDHRNVNMDVPEFRDLVPTSENIALVIERRLALHWTDHFGEHGPRLENVILHETRRNRFELR